MRNVRLVSTCLATALLTACPVSSPRNDPDGEALDAASDDSAMHPDAAVDPAVERTELDESWCLPWAEMLCEAGARCGCGASVAGGVLDVAGCIEHQRAVCMTIWGEGIDGGARVDADRATACLSISDTRTRACEMHDFATIYAECEPFVVDDAAVGEPCAATWCAGGEGWCSSGTCMPRIPGPEPCYETRACERGLVCSRGRCVPLTGEGVRGCVSASDCEMGLACFGGVCEVRHALGARCEEAEDCELGVDCVAGVCAAPSSPCAHMRGCGNEGCSQRATCQPPTGAGGDCGLAGSAGCTPELYCGPGWACAPRPADGEACSFNCMPGYGCDGGVCRLLPGVGMSCASDDIGPNACEAGLGCRGGVCVTMPTLGEACTDDGRCGPDLACNTGTCAVRSSEGGLCNRTPDCVSGLSCLAGRCRVAIPAGMPCDHQFGCLGPCQLGASGVLVCFDPPALGEPCASSTDCPSGLTCRNTSPTCRAPGCAEISPW